jgi:uncharacterized membrane protein YbhN (UPF0104 family)
VGRALQAAQFRVILRALEVDVGLPEAFGLVMCGAMYSYLTPARAGLGVQAVYLKRRHGLPFAHFGSLVVASNLLLFPAAAGLGLLAAATGMAGGVAMPPVLAFTFLGLLGLGLLGVTFVLLFGRLVRFVPTAILREACARMDDGLSFLFERPTLSLKIAGLRVGQIAAGAVGLMVACRSLGTALALQQAVPLRALASLAVFVPLTPGGLGVAEGAQAAGGGAWGLPVDSVVLAALVARAAGMVLVFGAGVAANWMLAGAVVGPPSPDGPEAD